MRLHPLLGRLSLAALSTAVTLGLIDACMRLEVGECGLTPFRNSPIDQLPHELAPGRATTYKGVPVRINRAGFRGAEWGEPEPGVERIALIGDSLTFGNGVSEEETLSAALELELARRGRAARVLNCGVPGYNAENVLALARERVLALSPARVIYVMVANDVSPTPARKAVIPADARIDACAQFPLRSPLLQLVNLRASAILRAFGFELGGYVDMINAHFENGGGERVGRTLAELQRMCAGRGIGFLAVVYPFLIRADRNPFRSIEEDYVRRCEELAIPCIRAIDAFAPGEELARFWVAPLDSHPDGEAHRSVATLIAGRLLAR